MFVGFNLTLNRHPCFRVEHAIQGKSLLDSQKRSVRNFFTTMTDCGKSTISAEDIENSWFPEVKADVFISHSHKDEELAMALAGWLNNTFGISCFVDSSVWSNVYDLINELDGEFGISKRDASGKRISYNYYDLIHLSSHAHLLLNMALNKMIDKSECIIFLNTPNSISDISPNKGYFTDSPWIYSELLFSSLVQHKQLSEYRRKGKWELSEYSIKYSAYTDHLYELSEQDLLLMKDLIRKGKTINPHDALDYLYSIKGIAK